MVGSIVFVDRNRPADHRGGELMTSGLICDHPTLVPNTSLVGVDGQNLAIDLRRLGQLSGSVVPKSAPQHVLNGRRRLLPLSLSLPRRRTLLREGHAQRGVFRIGVTAHFLRQGTWPRASRPIRLERCKRRRDPARYRKQSAVHSGVQSQEVSADRSVVFPDGFGLCHFGTVGSTPRKN